jgi:cell division protein FtsB
MRSKRWLGIAVFAAMAGALVACSGGISQAEYDSVKEQLTSEQQKSASLQQQISAKIAEATQLEQQIAAKEGDVEAAEEELASMRLDIEDLNASMGELAGVTPLIYSKIEATPAPRPAPTPPPAGYVPPTPVPPDSVTVDSVFPFTFYIEHLTGHQTTEVKQYPACVPNSQFQRGAHLVWRFEVFDTSNGKRLTSLDEPEINVVLPDGHEIAARFARRAGTGPWTWVAAWTIPVDYPLGALDYQILVDAKDGRSGFFDQDTVAVVNEERGTDSRIQVVE